MNKFILLVFGFIFSFSSINAQKNLNDYKYVIVPNKYDFFKEADKYQLNSLTKFLFKKYGFKALMADEAYPEDLANNGCLALIANVENRSSLFKTKLQVKLRDCTNSVVYTTTIGETREKEYDKSYNLALRDAFKSFENINYKYSGKSKEVRVEEVTEAVKEPKKEIKKEAETAEIKAEKIEPVKSEIPVIKKLDNVAPPNNDVLYAQKIENGFQLVDKEPKVLYVLIGSGIKDIFIVKEKDAILYKDQDKWIFAQVVNDVVKTKYLNIKF